MKTRTHTRPASLAFLKSLAFATLALFAHAHADTCRAQTQTPTQTQTQTVARPADASVAAREAGARERSSGSITGRVVGESGEALPGALVYVNLRGAAAQLGRAQRVATDDEGNFQITGLDPGLYNVFANIPGYIPDTDFMTGRPRAYRPGDTVALRLVKGGVITGTVTDTQGDPLVGLGVRAYRVRDLDGRVNSFGYNTGFEDKTDDRGVYRIFGLMPGVYVVSAGTTSRGFFYGYVAAHAGEVPTFYPSATRDTASEITVRAGQENAGVDIRYRDEQGRNVTGRVETPAGSQVNMELGFNVTLAYATTGIQAGITFLQPNSLTFAFDGVADGEYDVQAVATAREGQAATSAPQRVSVRGADVTGLKLTLAPLASVSGGLSIEQAKATELAGETCRQQRSSMLPQETLVTLVADRRAPDKGQAASRNSFAREAAPDASGAFALRGLEQGRYRLVVRPFDEALYVRSVQIPPAASAHKPPAPTYAKGTATKVLDKSMAGDNARLAASMSDALEVRAGQQVSGVAVRLSEGAAALSGRVVVAEGSAPQSLSQMRVYLVPAEREGERADDPLRYFDATPDASGAFTFKSLPPGRYLVVARPAPEPSADAPPRPPQWDSEPRALLRRQAEDAKSPVELQPCQRATDFVLRLPK